MSSVQKDIMEFLIAHSEELALPSFIQMDYLPSRQDAISFQPDSSPKVEKAYIGGAKVCSFPFTILASTAGNKSSSPSLKAIDWLNAIASLFEGMNNFQLSESRRVISGEAMTPALLNRFENGQIVYSISITIKYEE